MFTKTDPYKVWVQDLMKTHYDINENIQIRTFPIPVWTENSLWHHENIQIRTFPIPVWIGNCRSQLNGYEEVEIRSGCHHVNTARGCRHAKSVTTDAAIVQRLSYERGCQRTKTVHHSHGHCRPKMSHIWGRLHVSPNWGHCHVKTVNHNTGHCHIKTVSHNTGHHHVKL